MTPRGKLAGGADVVGMLGLRGERRLARLDTPNGSFMVEVDERGALLCPVCGARFYNARDLVWHLAYHARAQGRRG